MKSREPISKWIANARPYEVLSLGLQMEVGAQYRYSKMAAAADHRLARAKFRYLAAEEREHARLLAAARRGMERPAKMRPLPVSLSEVRGRARGDNPEAVLRLAIRAEKHSEKFYGQCSRLCRGPAARRLFEQMAEQEARHAAALREELGELRGEFAWRSLEGTPPAEEDFWG